MKQPEKAWCKAAKEMWKATLRDYVLEDAHHIELLRSACTQLTRAWQCREVLAAEGVCIRDRHDQPKPHPLLAEERAAHNAFRLLLRELGCDHEDSEVHRLPRIAGQA